MVNIFETGSVQGQYGSVTLIPGDTSHLTYGRSQTTLASGNLSLLIKAYCAAASAQFAAALNPYLQPLAARDTTLDTDMTFRGLRACIDKKRCMHCPMCGDLIVPALSLEDGGVVPLFERLTLSLVV